MAPLFAGAMLAANPFPGSGQTGALGAWVEEARATPFHHWAETGSTKTDVAGSSAHAPPRPSYTGWAGLPVDPDSISRGRVFGYTLVAAALPTAVGALAHDDHANQSDIFLLVYGWLGAELAGGTIATGLAGVGTGRAILASLIGVGVGGAGLLLIGAEAGVSWWIALPTQVFLTAGVTTLVATP